MTDGDGPDEKDAIASIIKAHIDVILIHGQDFTLRGDLLIGEGLSRMQFVGWEQEGEHGVGNEDKEAVSGSKERFA